MSFFAEHKIYRRYWTPKIILDACREWVVKYGDYPSAFEWSRADIGHPDKNTVCDVFGSWNAMIAAAGYVPRTGNRITWSRERIVEAFLDWLGAHDRWPTTREWHEGTDKHPHFHTVQRVFGSWNEARRVAGYTGSPHAKLCSKSRNVRRFVSA